MAVGIAFMETIPAQQIVDRMLGAIIGHALGDAIGLPNEYVSAPVPWPHAESHRGFTPNDWSEKTDHMVLVMHTLIDHESPKSTPSWERTALAAQLIKWSQTGLAECGDTAPVGIGGSIGAVMAEPDFAADPTHAALSVWTRSQGVMCTNAHMSRSVPTGLIADRKIAADLARSLAMVTHADPRAHTASAIYALVINGLVHTNDDASAVLASACAEALSAVDVGATDTSAQLSTATQAGFTGTLGALDLNGNGSAGALRALSVMAYTLQILARAESAGTTPSFVKIVRAVAEQRGSASVNAGIAGSIVGAALGCSRLPENLLDALPHGAALAELVGRYVSAVKKPAPLRYVC